jgi:hypothetical protein
MKRLFGLVIILAALTSVPTRLLAQSLSDIGVGPHGYDLLIGNWNCTDNLAPGGTGNGTLTIAATGVGNALSFHITGKTFDNAGYITYDAKTKTWWSPTAYFDGGYTTESTTQTGPKTVWAGSAAGIGSTKPVMVRDTYAFPNMTRYTDLFEIQGPDGAWKASANFTCNKQ